MQDFDFANTLTMLLGAARWTLMLSVIAFAFGGAVGLLVMVMRISPIRPLRWISRLYIEFFQGTPLLVQLFLIFFGLPILIGYNISPLLSAGIALTIYTSAFLADIWRGCVESISRGQWEGSAALGLSFLQQLWHVILPQAIKISIPPSIGFLVQVVKNTSLTAIIGYVELTRQGQILNNVTFRPFTIFLMVGAIYFVICFPLSRYSKVLESKLAARQA
ncbi:amino acid ABC transporter permease [Promineifilum sp.]|uniref:amino acid ABC transporter permease n=1 Tax=Promineifilum sp. TaxID=2664178 RepID=UPI0035B1F6E4